MRRGGDDLDDVGAPAIGRAGAVGDRHRSEEAVGRWRCCWEARTCPDGLAAGAGEALSLGFRVAGRSGESSGGRSGG